MTKVLQSDWNVIYIYTLEDMEERPFLLTLGAWLVRSHIHTTKTILRRADPSSAYIELIMWEVQRKKQEILTHFFK